MGDWPIKEFLKHRFRNQRAHLKGKGNGKARKGKGKVIDLDSEDINDWGDFDVNDWGPHRQFSGVQSSGGQ